MKPKFYSIKIFILKWTQSVAFFIFPSFENPSNGSKHITNTGRYTVTLSHECFYTIGCLGKKLFVQVLYLYFFLCWASTFAYKPFIMATKVAPWKVPSISRIFNNVVNSVVWASITSRRVSARTFFANGNLLELLIVETVVDSFHGLRFILSWYPLKAVPEILRLFAEQISRKFYRKGYAASPFPF